jgi:hypothetical protein
MFLEEGDEFLFKTMLLVMSSLRVDVGDRVRLL